MTSPVISGPDIASLAMSLVVVVAAVVGLGWLYSRMRFSSGGAGDLINVVASRALGPKERLLLVQVDDQQLLVGITATQIRTLHSFDKPVAADVVSSDVPGFADRLKTAIRGTVK